jgi:hypothetical protein
VVGQSPGNSSLEGSSSIPTTPTENSGEGSPPTNKTSSSPESEGSARVARSSSQRTSSVNPTSSEVSLTAVRATPNIGKDAEHGSAYVLFQELAYSSLEKGRMADGVSNLIESFSCLPLKQEAIVKISHIQEGMPPELAPRERRKEATENLRSANYLHQAQDYANALVANRRSQLTKEGTQPLLGLSAQDEEVRLDNILNATSRANREIEIRPISEAIRLGNRASLSPYVREITDECVFAAGNMVNASFPDEGVPKNPNTGQERWAKDDLVLLSNFMLKIRELHRLGRSEEDQAKKQEEIDSLDWRKLNKKWGIDKERINDLLDQEEGQFQAGLDSLLEIRLEDSLTVQDKISQRMGHLFYYPRVDPNNLPENSPAWKNALEQKKYKQGTRPRDNDPEIMYEVVGRHIVLVMNCFKGLGEFNAQKQEELVNSFLQKSVLENSELNDGQGWKDEIFSNMPTEFALPQLKDFIGGHATIRYSINPNERTFYTKNSTIDIRKQVEQLVSVNTTLETQPSLQ